MSVIAPDYQTGYSRIGEQIAEGIEKVGALIAEIFADLANKKNFETAKTVTLKEFDDHFKGSDDAGWYIPIRKKAEAASTPEAFADIVENVAYIAPLRKEVNEKYPGVKLDAPDSLSITFPDYYKTYKERAENAVKNWQTKGQRETLSRVIGQFYQTDEKGQTIIDPQTQQPKLKEGTSQEAIHRAGLQAGLDEESLKKLSGSARTEESLSKERIAQQKLALEKEKQPFDIEYLRLKGKKEQAETRTLNQGQGYRWSNTDRKDLMVLKQKYIGLLSRPMLDEDRSTVMSQVEWIDEQLGIKPSATKDLSGLDQFLK